MGDGAGAVGNGARQLYPDPERMYVESHAVHVHVPVLYVWQLTMGGHCDTFTFKMPCGVLVPSAHVPTTVSSSV